jgi:hypothetical protein
VIHRAAPSFWTAHNSLPDSVRDIAKRTFAQMKFDPRHPSLHLKKTGRFWSVRVGLHHRALAVEIESGLLWFWIGSHADYERIIR